MNNTIERDVLIFQDGYKEPIRYVRATNAIPIMFHFRDYDIPEGAEAKVFVAKPSGKAVYAQAQINGNDILVQVTTQMFAELGNSDIQIRIDQNDCFLVTFTWPVIVYRNFTEGDIPPSKNESGFFDELQNAADNANAAANSANKAAQDANGALESIKDAVQGTLINDSNPSENTVYSSQKVEDKFFRIDTTLGYECKNLIPYPYDVSTITTNGITFTDNGDGTVKVNGTATANAFFNCQTRVDTKSPFILKKGKYILSGCASGGAYGKYAIAIAKTGSDGNAETFGRDTGDGLEFYLKEDSETTQVQIIVWQGTTVNNLTFKPMLRTADIKDDTWEPYRKSQREINDEGEESDAFTESTLGYKCKNLIPYPYDNTTKTDSGITWTDVGDGTIKAIGTAQKQVHFYCHARTDSNTPFSLKKGIYILSGCPSGGSGSTYRIAFGETEEGGSSGHTICTDYGLNGEEGVRFSLDHDVTTGQVDLYVESGYTANELVFKPMIRRAEIMDYTWEPYKPSIKERITKINADMSEIHKQMEELKKKNAIKNILVIGDSNLLGWGGVTVWAKSIKEVYPGWFNYHFDGGAGFKLSLEHNFSGVLTKASASYDEDTRKKVDIVCVFGGPNDRNSSESDIESGIQDFANKVKMNFPNAQFKIFGMFTHLDSNTDHDNTMRMLDVYRRCSSIGINVNAVYITNSEYVTHRYDIFQDGVHLNQTGQDLLRRFALQGILSNTVDVHYSHTQTIKDSLVMKVEMVNQVTTIRLQGRMNVTVPAGENLRMMEIAQVTPVLVNFTSLDFVIAGGFENETYLGIMPFAGDIQLYSPSLGKTGVIVRLYAHSQELMNWVVDNITIRGCAISVCTDQV